MPRAQQFPEDKAGAISAWLWVYCLVAVGRLPDMIPGSQYLSLGKVVFAGTALATMLGWRRLQHRNVFGAPMVRTAMAFFVLGAFSVVFSIWKGNSLRAIPDMLLVLALTFLITAKAIVSWSDIKRVLHGIAMSGVLLALLTLIHYGGGRAELNVSYDTNDLAFVLVSILPLLLAFATIRSGLRRWMYVGMAALVTAVALLTQSRGGFLALVAVFVALVCMPVWKGDVEHQAPGLRKNKANILARVLVLGAIAFAVWGLLPSDTRSRLSSVLTPTADYNTNMENEGGRLAIWQRNFMAAVHQPIGYGIGAFEALDGRISGRYKASHNSVLQVFVELGVLGLFLFLRMYYLSWRTLGTLGTSVLTVARRQEGVVFSRALRVSLLAIFVGGFFLSQAYSNILWMTFATIAATSVASGTRTAQRIPRIG